MAIIRFDDVVLVVFDITAVDPILSAVCEMDMVDFLKSISDHLRPSNSERRIPVANANLNSAWCSVFEILDRKFLTSLQIM